MFEKTLKKYTDKLFIFIEEYARKGSFEYGTKFRKVIYFIGYEALPFIFTIATYFTLFYILTKVKGKYGFETAVLVCLIMLILKRGGSDD